MTNKIRKNLYVLSTLLIVILALYLLKVLKMFHIICLLYDVLLPVMFGYIFAWILFPIFRRMNKKLNRKVSLSLLIVFFIIVYGLILWKFLPLLITNVSNIIEMFNHLIDQIVLVPYLQGLEKFRNIDVGVIIDSCSNIVSSVGIFALAHVFGFYILFTYESINNFFKRCVPLKYKKIYGKYTSLVSLNMRQYLKGTLIDTAILFVASSVAYFFIGLKYPMLLALFSAITNIIPFFGPYIGGAPAVLIGFSGGINIGIITLCVICVLQLIESNILNPMIMSKCIRINPILIIIALTIMGKFFGLIGMIFAVPTLILVKITLPYLSEYKSKFKSF